MSFISHRILCHLSFNSIDGKSLSKAGWCLHCTQESVGSQKQECKMRILELYPNYNAYYVSRLFVAIVKK